MAPRLVLVGLPGVGKTTVGRALARTLQVPFADTDDLLVATTGRSVAELFAESEAAFRRAEAAAVLAALREFDGVLALGGGALINATVRTALTAAPVVCLTAELTTLATRVGDGRTRPLLAGSGDITVRLRTLATERAELFAPYPRVATDSLDVEAVVSRLAGHVVAAR